MQRRPDRVLALGLAYECRIGFHPGEEAVDQRLEIDVEAETDWRAAARADDPSRIVDYHVADGLIRELVTGRRWLLVEAVAEAVAALVCARFDVSGVRVRVTKHPLDMRHARAVAVECWRTPADFGASP
jgi:dihydroneopterin aldolase